MQKYFDRIVTISTSDPDDARRRRLLNILMAGMFAGGLGAMLPILALMLLSPKSLTGPGSQLLLPSALTFMLGTALLYVVNRRSGSWAAFLFLLMLTLGLTFSDTPVQVAAGRTTLFFTIPIVMSSLIMLPAASFLFAALSSGILIWMALSASLFPNVPAIVGYFTLALVSWLASRGLEQALKELRVTNANLDKLVAERTQALAQALARERSEAGQRQAILNSIADGVIVYDTARKSILANPAIQGLLDAPAEQIVNKTFGELVQSPFLSARDRGLLQAMMETNTQPSSFRVEWGKKTLSVSAAQVYDTENLEIGTVAVFRDVTREAELERMKSSFIAIVSHELRTPLNAIMGFAEMLRESVYGPVNEKQSAASDRIVMNTRHMLGMVGDLLDQAQIEAGKLRISSEQFKPADLLRGVQEVMSQIVADKGLSLTGEIDPRLPQTFTGDPSRLQQILINLVNNAVKFTDTGGVHIRMFLADLKHWGLEVRDTGRGIPEPELDHIFDAFHQVDSTTTRQQGGFGLGLSIVRQLVQLMNGKIYVESTVGRGSTLTITLPLAEEDLAVKRAMSHSALIVEDDADLAAIFAEALKSAGFEPQVIRDGAIAQRRIKEMTPHIIILDLHLPHVDGSTLLTQIRSDGALKGTIVIVATADALMGELYRDVADIVLIKPISFIQLRDLSARLRAVQLNPSTEVPSSRSD
jgi:PAS domain S-box-containing protein